MKVSDRRLVARDLIRSNFEGQRFRCQAVSEFVHSHDPYLWWDLYKAFDETKKAGLVIRVEGRLGSTIYEWK